MRRSLLLIGILLILLYSCERLVMKSEADSDVLSIFDEFATVFREKYAMFETKNVNWDSLYAVEQEKLKHNQTEDALKNAVARMVLALRDGHTSVVFNDSTGVSYPIDFVGIDTTAPDSAVVKFQPNCYDTTERVIKQYVSLKQQVDGLDFGIIGDTIGFIRYRDFLKDVSDADMDAILLEFRNTKGLIFDARGNAGGDPATASMMASHFTGSRQLAGYENFKIGPGATDFRKTDLYTRVTTGELYTRPVVMLGDIGCYSATTTLHYLSLPNENVILLGDTTGGGSGSVYDNELSNGWFYSLSSSEFITAENEHIDNGIIPDIVVIDTLFEDGDALIDSAIAYIARQK